MHYTNHFGEKSLEYKQYRPDYPSALYKYLAGLASVHDLAWDCGTGNGQAAVQLAAYFKQVVGSDINQAQLDVAEKRDNIGYYCWPAEKTELHHQSVDLVTVAQALHWFNLEAFYNEVQRVTKRNGVIAAWCYSLGSMDDDINGIIRKLYSDILGDAYWPAERHYIDDEYQTIYFPFKKMATPGFQMERQMNFSQLVGYLNTWSAVKEYQKINHTNPINLIYSELQIAWGNPEMERTMCWPIHLLAGVVA